MGKKQKKIGPITEAKHKKIEARKQRKVARKANKASGSVSSAKPKTQRAPVEQITSAPAAVGGASRSYFTMKPLAGSGGQGVRIRGCDFLTTVVYTSGTPAGTALFNMAMNPTALVGTRLATMVALYEKYRFNRFVIRVIPMNNTNANGSYGIAYDRDPTDVTPPVGDDGIRQYMAMPGTVVSTQWQPSSLNCPLMSPETCYFTNSTATSDERLVDQGQLYIFTAMTGTANLNYFVEIEYDISLWIPEVSATLMTGDSYSQQKVSTVGLLNTATNKLWNVLSDTTTWNSPIFRGALNKAFQYATVPAGIYSDGINFKGIFLPSGIWSVQQSISGKGNTVSGWAASAGISPPTLQAVESKEQSDCLVDVIYSAYTSSGVVVSDTLGVTRTDEIYSPPSGAWLLGSQNAIAQFSSVAGTGAIYLDINPTKNSVTFSPLLGKTAKFREPIMARVKEILAQKQKDREEKERRERELGVAPSMSANQLPQYASPQPQLFRQ